MVIGTATAGSLAAGCGGTMSTGQCMGDPPSTAIIVTTAEQQAADKDKVSRVGDTIVYITKDDKGYMAIDSRCQHAWLPDRAGKRHRRQLCRLRLRLPRLEVLP